MEGMSALCKARAGKYLTFQLDREIYGLDIMLVQEIMGLLNVTHVPRTPEFIRGVINLRGRVIPVIDLRLKFGLAAAADTERTCIIVVQIQRAGAALTMGIIVDEVSEVINIESGQIEETPSFGAQVDTSFLLGIGKVNQKVVMLLDVNQVLSESESLAVGQVAEDVQESHWLATGEGSSLKPS